MIQAQLAAEWTEQQYEPSYERAETTTLWLPEPQAKFVHPPGPGKRLDGKLWFEVGSRRSIAGDKVDMMKYSVMRIPLPPDAPKPRDFRKGDRWLPWHFQLPRTP